MDQESTFQQLQEQLANQQAQIEQQTRQIQALLQQQSPESFEQTEVQMSEAPNLHNLPIRPVYDWTPSPEVAALIPTREQDIFLEPLDQESKKAVIELYPPMNGLRYTPPQRIPTAARKYNKSQLREDDSLQRIQYAISASLRPLDVLVHMLHPSLSEEDMDRVALTIHHTRMLILNSAGVANEQRANLMLRVLNPEFQPVAQDSNYIMSLPTLQDTLTQHAALQKAIKDVQPKRQFPNRFTQPAPQQQPQFFRDGPPLGGGGREKYNSKNYNEGFKRSANNSKHPFKNQKPPQQQPQHQQH
ncbi:unnamed protein product [Umbelopsis ramanniana]